MKKKLAVLLALIMVFVMFLGACGGTAEHESSQAYGTAGN